MTQVVTPTLELIDKAPPSRPYHVLSELSFNYILVLLSFPSFARAKENYDHSNTTSYLPTVTAIRFTDQ